MNITFAGHQFFLHPSGILFWPKKSLAIVSDLHLEKGSHFALKGFFLPPYDSHETLERLHTAIKGLGARQLMVLGDGFHDSKGHGRLAQKGRELFDALITFNPIWILGNHDAGFVPEGFSAHEVLKLDNITFIHEATTETPYEISGHFHPKTEILHKHAFISRPCFIEDGNKMILPAFGSYTGGLFITHSGIQKVFKDDVRTYALGERKVYFLKKP